MSYISSKGGCIASGNAGKDGEFSRANEKNAARYTFSIAAGKDAEGSAIWFNCVAWRDMAEYCQKLGIRKGERVTVFGSWQSNERDGKTYHNLVVDQVWAMRQNQEPVQSAPVVQTGNGEAWEVVDDSELPF